MKAFLELLSPFAPHIAEELWEIQGYGGMALAQSWPGYDESKTLEAVKELAVQVNGRLRSTVTVPADEEDAAVVEAAKADPKVQRLMEGMEVVKTIVVKNKLVNLILREAK